MSDDEVTRFIALIAEWQSTKNTATIWMDLAFAEAKAAATNLAAIMDELQKDFDAAFAEISAEYDDGWDILREINRIPQEPTDA